MSQNKYTNQGGRSDQHMDRNSRQNVSGANIQNQNNSPVGKHSSDNTDKKKKNIEDLGTYGADQKGNNSIE